MESIGATNPSPPTTLQGVERHAHARAMLVPALPPHGTASHAYLFYGPEEGKLKVALSFAAALLAEGAPEPAQVVERVRRGAHPDLTWVTPSGANELLVSDVDEAVVGAIAHTPFEATRRVFVIEAAGTMNDQAANRLLKTLEEPPGHAHLILLAEHREDVLPTVASRCQAVRFDPLPNEVVEESLRASFPAIDPRRATACARLSAGDAQLAEYLASEEGEALRGAAEGFVREALAGRIEGRPWSSLLDGAKLAGELAAEAGEQRVRERAELLPVKERRKYEREGAESVRRAERRARTKALGLGLRLAELWVRDAWCLTNGAQELVFALDRLSELQADASGRAPDALGKAIELIGDTRLRLTLNVSEELALEALAYRLAELLGQSDD